MTLPDLGTSLDRLDAGFVPLQLATQAISRGNPPVLPRFQDARLAARVEALERHLVGRYGADFGALPWHGPTSIQRMVWQDAATLEMLADQAAVNAILCRGAQQQEADLGSAMTLSRVLVGGLARNRPSYLFSACPNWRLRPHAPGVYFACLSDMSVPDDKEQMEPFTLGKELLDAARSAMASFQQTLVDDLGVVKRNATNAVWEAIDRATARVLLKAVNSVLSLDVAFRLMEGSGNPSMALPRMNGQCLEVMHYYGELLAAHDNSHEVVIGFGLVSHALDAKHLAATLVHGLGLGHIRYRRVTDKTAIRSFEDLLSGAVRCELGNVANALMRARLQQVMRLLCDHRVKLGLTETELLCALGDEPTKNSRRLRGPQSIL